MPIGELGIIDSGILQFAPKGAYYEEKDEQYQAVKNMWMQLLDYDRTLFSLVMLLNGTGFSKGAMSHILLSNSIKNVNNLPAITDGLPEEFEKEIIRYNLYKERTPRALKNLLMLAGEEGHKKINNSKTRKIILEFIFNRDNKSLDYLAVNYKIKLQKLIKHALGKQDLYKILNGSNSDTIFRKNIGRYNNHSFPVVCHIFNKPIPSGTFFPMIQKYYELKDAAKIGNLVEFRKHMKGFPERTVMGMRNLYKLDIPISDIKNDTQKSEKDKIQGIAAAKRAGAKKVDINYKKQDIYDLFKLLYFKLNTKDEEDVDKIIEAMDYVTDNMIKLDIGECIVIMDASHSMFGSEERPMHPFLTGLCIIANLDNVKDIIYVGGQAIKFSTINPGVIIPKNYTDLWRALIKAVSKGVENIVIISDGYENSIKGMFGHVYKHLKETGYNFKLTHLNPVFSAGSLTGTSIRLTEDVRPFPVGDYKFLETEIIFSKLIEDKDMVRKLLISKYKSLIQ